MDPEVIGELRERLTEAAIKCSERCLYHSAKWAAELLDSLPADEDAPESDDDSPMLNAGDPVSSYRIFSTSYEDPREAALELKEAPKYLLAKSYFDTREYDRCADVFLPPAIPAGGLAIFEKAKSRTPTSTPSKLKGSKNASRTSTIATSPFPKLSQKSLFLALYARYLAGEKRKDEESEMVLGPADGGQTTNRELPALARGLEVYFQSRQVAKPQLSPSQGWLEYLYGVILARSKHSSAAQDYLLASVRLNPYHWGAWEELASLLSSVDDLDAATNLPKNIMTFIYQTTASVDLCSSTSDRPVLSNLNFLLSVFPSSPFILTQLALWYYHRKDFDSSASIFQSILTAHPYRLDALDHYSNILYVMADRPKLSFLAHLCTSIDKFRPETCCVVGNYYSLCSQHEKAVMYFRRALTLDRNFLSAWTLMGHEYIELKNTHAAIESYRRAVDVNRKDYRAWYGLGQAYEVLDMGFYALYYYQTAAGLRPMDAKMWQAVGSCYNKMGKEEKAIKALKRALIAGTYFETESPQASFSTSHRSSLEGGARKKTGRKLLDPETLWGIAQLYEKLGDAEEASRWMELCVGQERGESGKAIAAVERKRKRAERREARRVAMEQRKEQRAAAAAASGLASVSNAGAGADEEEEIDFGDGDTEILSSSASESEVAMDDGDDNAANSNVDDGFGTGTTATTSKARLWLARYAWKNGDLPTAERLAEELCVDGYEVEEAKGLVREVRAVREAGGGVGGGVGGDA